MTAAACAARPTISVVTPTLSRPSEVRDLLLNLCHQTLLPLEVVVVDAAPPHVPDTERLVSELAGALPFRSRYVRHGGGTAIQRNVGIDIAEGDFIAFVDDDVRLDPDYFSIVLAEYARDEAGRVGGIAGYIANQYLDAATSRRWRWYRRLRLFTTYEPGRYDYVAGYPINRYLQPPHAGVREIDFMGANCAVWRRSVFDGGLRFAPFFTGYAVLEDAHLALSARRRGWRILECGAARCVHLHSPNGRTSKRDVAWKSAVNYRYVFVDIVPRRTFRQEARFWSVQAFDLARYVAYAVRTRRPDDWQAVVGKLGGIMAATRVTAGAATAP
jgi:GT2 family glycosyltransferase